jgi:hypothetical protein
MLNTRVVDGFLTQEEVSLFLDFSKSSNMWTDGDITKTGGDFWSGRLIAAPHMPIELAVKMIQIKDRLDVLIEHEYGVKYYCDQICLNRWFDGMEQDFHSDDMKGFTGHEDFTWFHHRELSCIIYLNNDFEGGLTHYKNFPDSAVTPKPGRVAIHPGDLEHMHGVSKISGNTRYTMPSFWGTDPAFNTPYDKFR